MVREKASTPEDEALDEAAKTRERWTVDEAAHEKAVRLLHARFPASATYAAQVKLFDKLHRYRAALSEIREKRGYCIFGTSELPGDPELAFRLGSAMSYSECASIANEALDG
jgi:hypothetical protein